MGSGLNAQCPPTTTRGILRTPVGGAHGHSREIQALEHVGVDEFRRQPKGKDVEPALRAAWWVSTENSGTSPARISEIMSTHGA